MHCAMHFSVMKSFVSKPSIASKSHLPTLRTTLLPAPPSHHRRLITTQASPHIFLDLATTASTASDLLHIHPDTTPESFISHFMHFADAALADPSVITSTTTSTASASTQPDNGWLAPLVNELELVLGFIQDSLDKYHVPYSKGWSIVALTAFVKLLTFPLTKTQVESSMSTQSLKPKIDAIKEKYGDNKAAIQRETSALYEKAGVNPLAGCLPSIATIPIFIGLYRSLTSVAAQGQLDNEGFYWVPSLAGPTSVAAQRAGAGIAWLYPFVNGEPPVGWEMASRYLALPIALVIAQYISSAIISPPIDPNSDNANVQKAIYLALPLMVGWFALNVPSGLSLYYFSNTVLTSAQQIFLRKLGGAKAADYDLGPIELGKARRTGSIATADDDVSMQNGAPQLESSASMSQTSSFVSGEAVPTTTEFGSEIDHGNGVVAVADDGSNQMNGAVAAVPIVNRRCKRKKRELLEA